MRSKSYCKFPVPVNSDKVGNWFTYLLAVSVGVSLGITFMVFAVI